MKLILVDGINGDEVRVAVVENGRLVELDYDIKCSVQLRGNVYVGFITRVEPSLQAAFVDYGADKHGFLPFDEISEEYYFDSRSDRRRRTLIQDVVFIGQKVLVQVIKDVRRNKGVTLTTYMTLVGQTCVFMPNTPPTDYLNRRLSALDSKKITITNSIHKASGSSLILRSGYENVSENEVRQEYKRLNKIWSAIEKGAESAMNPQFLYGEGNAIKRTMNHNISDAEEVIIEGAEVYKDTVRHVNNSFYGDKDKNKIKFYSGYIALFTYYDIETQINGLYSNVVRLTSGGSIVFGITEALISIDVNSGRMTRDTTDMESTAVKTNKEAVHEIARQLCLRNLSGLMVLDLISMYSYSNRQLIEAELRKALMCDRAKINMGKINEFGLLELSRQRIGVAFHELNLVSCSACHGTGSVRSLRSSADVFMKSLAKLLAQCRYNEIKIVLSRAMMAYLMNNCARYIADLRGAHGVRISYEVSEDVDREGFVFMHGNVIIEPDSQISEHEAINILMEEYLGLNV